VTGFRYEAEANGWINAEDAHDADLAEIHQPPEGPSGNAGEGPPEPTPRSRLLLEQAIRHQERLVKVAQIRGL
jgi:hypothetical protein